MHAYKNDTQVHYLLHMSHFSNLDTSLNQSFFFYPQQIGNSRLVFPLLQWCFAINGLEWFLIVNGLYNPLTILLPLRADTIKLCHLVALLSQVQLCFVDFKTRLCQKGTNMCLHIFPTKTTGVNFKKKFCQIWLLN